MEKTIRFKLGYLGDFKRAIGRYLICKKTANSTVKEGREFKNIENENDFDFVIADKKAYPGISAMMRVKNEEAIVQASILSIIDFVDEVVVIDNASDDLTVKKVKELETKYSDKIKLEYYPFLVKRCGNEFIHTPENSVHSLAYYYNWCRSKCNYSYLLKWDADMIIPKKYNKHWRNIRKRILKKENYVFKPRGELVILDKGSVFRETLMISKEDRIYPNNPDYYYIKMKGFPTERLSYKGNLIKYCNSDIIIKNSKSVVFFEIKDATKEEFQHFSDFDFDYHVKQKSEFLYFNEVMKNPNNFPRVKVDSILDLINQYNKKN
jgi:hypothetical protein